MRVIAPGEDRPELSRVEAYTQTASCPSLGMLPTLDL